MKPKDRARQMMRKMAKAMGPDAEPEKVRACVVVVIGYLIGDRMKKDLDYEDLTEVSYELIKLEI